MKKMKKIIQEINLILMYKNLTLTTYKKQKNINQTLALIISCLINVARCRIRLTTLI